MDTLIVYYSWSGNTRKLAEIIRQETGGDILEIRSTEPYPTDYNACVEQAKKEIKANYRPALTEDAARLGGYDIIFVGSPNWWSTIAPPVAAFLEKNGLSGKTVVPFCTHGGGGFGHIEKDIAVMCSESTLLTGFSVYGRGDGNMNKQIDLWLRKIDISKSE